MDTQEPAGWEREFLVGIFDAQDGATKAIRAIQRRRKRPADTNASPLDARNLEAHLCTLELHVRQLRERWGRLR